MLFAIALLILGYVVIPLSLVVYQAWVRASETDI